MPNISTSHLELKSVRNRTQVVRMLHRAPLRLFQTQCGRQTAEIFTSTFGGGILQGDRTHLKIGCGARTRTVIRSQANTQVYKNPMGIPSIQSIAGTLQEESLLVLAPDPVVMHREALFHLDQHWDLADDASLVLLDSFQSGRSESGEQFQFREYLSNIHITRKEKTLLRETFRCRPKEDSPQNPARFGGFDVTMTIHLIGPQVRELVRQLEPFTNRQKHVVPLLPAVHSLPLQGPFYSLSPLPFAEGTLFRALARKRIDLDPAVALVRNFL